MDFDKGWSRLEKLLLLWGVLLLGFIGLVDGVDMLKKIATEESSLGRTLLAIAAFGPWFVAKIIKWIIDGFRG